MAVISNLTIAVYPTDLEGRISLQDIVDTVQANMDGGGEAPVITWQTIEGKPAFIGAGETQAAARAAIGAGTGNSNLALGTSATTAAMGNHTHTAANISDTTAVGRSVMTAADAAAARTAIGAGTSNLAIGASSNQAAAGNHTHSNYATTQALTDLTARVAALEAASA